MYEEVFSGVMVGGWAHVIPSPGKEKGIMRENTAN